MAYEIPQQLEYKEKIMFGLTFKQLLYAFLFAPLIVLIFFKTHWNFILKILLGTNLIAIGIGFIFLDLERHLKNWIRWYISKKIEKPEKLAKFIPIKEIANEIILTSDNRKLAILKINPINFSIKPEESKNAIALGFQKLLNSLDFPVQILMNTENLDLEEYLMGVERKIEQQKKFDKLFHGYRNHLEKVTSSNNVLNRSFYLIIPEKNDLSVQLEICQQRLYSLGLKSTRLRNKELTILLKEFFEAKTGFFPALIENFPSYSKIDNTFSRVIYAHGYPRSVETGFLDKIVSTPGNFDLSLHIEPYDIETMMVFLNKELQKQRADLYAAKLRNILNPSLEIKYKDTKSVLENLQKGKDKLFNVSLYINCRAKSKEDLELLTRRVESELNSLLIIPKQPIFRMLQGLQSCSPLAINSLKQPRSVPTAALSAFFPFTSSFLQADNTGVWLGLNKNNIPIIKDIFTLSNPNGLCLASSGSGKSYMAKLLISRYLLNDIKVMIIDPQGEYRGLVGRFGGQLIDLSRNSKTIINPLDLMGHDYLEKRLALMDLLPIMLGDLSDPQKAVIDRAITDTYEMSRITEDPQSWSNEPPILEDLLYSLEKMKKKSGSLEKPTIQSLVNRLSMYTEGVFSFLNKRTNIKFDNQLVCFDIGSLPKQVKPVMMFLVLDYIHMKMKKDLNRKLLVVDEAWSLLGRAHDASYLFEIVKTCRKFNLALFLINQEVEGMLSSEAGKSVLANTSYTLLMRQKPAVIKNIKQTFYLSDTESNALLTAGIGEGLLLMEDEHSEIKIVASEEEHKIITTNADEILRNDLSPAVAEDPSEYSEKNVKIDKNEQCFSGKNLSEKDVYYLKSRGFVIVKTNDLYGKKEDYLVKSYKNESIHHIILTSQIAEYLKKYVKKVEIYRSVRPDIVFETDGKRYAIEVETGTTMRVKDKITRKVNELNKEFQKRWFFVLTDRNLLSKYKKLGKSYYRENIRRKLDQIIKNE